MEDDLKVLEWAKAEMARQEREAKAKAEREYWDSFIPWIGIPLFVICVAYLWFGRPHHWGGRGYSGPY